MCNMKLLKNRKLDVPIPKKGKCHCMNPCSQPVLSPTPSWAFPPEPVLRGEHTSPASKHHWWVTSSQEKLPNPTNNQETEVLCRGSFLLIGFQAQGDVTPLLHWQTLESVIRFNHWNQFTSGSSLEAQSSKPLQSTQAAVDSSQLWWSPIKISLLFTLYFYF